VAELTPAEVRALWELRDDAILDARPRLWATWGFCPRHAWGQFTVELELRGLPPTTITLYEDLLRRAVEPTPDRLDRLRPTGGCPVCEGPLDEDGWAVETAVVNRRERTITLLQECASYWTPRTCPRCLGGDGLICRPHLLEDGGSFDAPVLMDLRRVVEGVGDALSYPPRTVLPREWAALVETLGWFAGWTELRGILPSPYI
jgi:hypothetical protein